MHKTKHRNSNAGNLFKCGVGETQAAITPFGELKMCLMIDYPRYNILESSLQDCWERLKELVASIKPDENYQCDRCKVEPYCKWCPAKAWLNDRSFTSCDSESRTRAELMKQCNNVIVEREVENVQKTKIQARDNADQTQP